MSTLSAIRAPALGGSEATDAASTDIRGRTPRLVVVTPAGRAPAGRPARAGGAGEPRSSSIAPSMRASTRSGPGVAAPAVVSGTVLARRQAPKSQTPVRLTRRGRAVVASLLVTGLTVGALLISLLASGGAQATNHGLARAGYQGMRQIVVRPGQTLWSIASAAEPSADTRVVVQEIMAANALTSGDISAGQLLWVPR
jgi:Tfp pilus assembly protein FimV